MKDKKTENGNVKLVVNQENFMQSLIENIGILRTERNWSVRVLAEKAGISEDTLQTLLRGKSKDCNLSTVLKLALAFGVSIDRLVGGGTINREVMDFALDYQSLPKSSRALIKYHLDNQKNLRKKNNNKTVVKIMNPICNGNGNLKKNDDYEEYDISSFGEELVHKIYFGIKLPCEHYLPYYKENDLLFIANDRDAMIGENSVIVLNGNIVIVKRFIEDGKVKYRGIRDKFNFFTDEDSIVLIGYIAKVLSE